MPAGNAGRLGQQRRVLAHDARGGRGLRFGVLVKKLHADKSLEIDDICKTLRMSRSTFYRYVRL